MKSARTIVTILALFLYVSAASVLAQETETPDANAPAGKLRVDGERIKGYIEYLARDDLQGRMTLTPGYDKAAEWAVAHFKKWGLEPAGEDGTYFQNVPIEREVTQRTGVPEFKIGQQEYLMDEEDFSVQDVSTADTKVQAEVVFVGYGISDPNGGLDEYADVDVKGKVVLILQGSPNDRLEGERRGDDDEDKTDSWREYADETVKIKTAYDKDAAAVLLYEGRSEDAQEADRDREREDEPEELKPERNFLVFTISGRVMRAIMKPDRQETTRGFQRRLVAMREDIVGKKTRSENTKVKVRLTGYDTVVTYNKEQGNNLGRNVIAKIPGTDPKLKDQYVIMGGHMDHTGMRRGFVNNGADDNASGTATVLEIARVLGEAKFKPKRTIIFCCWTGEELGLHGSNQYVENPCDGVSVDRIVTYFNMDMVGIGETIGAPGALNFPTIWEVIKRDQDEEVMSIVEPRTGGPGGSDHSAFIRKGIEALALMTHGGIGHRDYHRPEDDSDKMDPNILAKTGQFVLQGTINLANETKTDLLIANRQDRYNAMRLYVANINPNLEDSEWSCIDLEGYSQDKLRWRVASVEENPRRSMNRGVRDLDAFGGDVELLLAASEALGFGRVDINGSDGQWVVGGKLTQQGRYALGMMQDNDIVVNLVSPSPRLLRGALKTATKPFLITGYYELTERLCDEVNEKKILLGVRFDPRDVESCVERLVEAKEALGDADNLILVLTSTEDLDEGKKALYMSLIEKGWTAEEIGGERSWRWRRNGRPGIAGGNLRVLR